MKKTNPVTAKTIAASRAKARSLAAERKCLGINLDGAAKIDVEECKRHDVDVPSCMLSAIAVETPEEREAFESLERRQRDPQDCDNRQVKINAMAAIARQCPTTSIEGICALLVDAGYEIKTNCSLN